MERKENRAMLGQQVINNGMGSSGLQNQAMAKVRHASAKKRPPQAMGIVQNQAGRNTQGGWANGQLPVAMQQQLARQGQTHGANQFSSKDNIGTR